MGTPPTSETGAGAPAAERHSPQPATSEPVLGPPVSADRRHEAVLTRSLWPGGQCLHLPYTGGGSVYCWAAWCDHGPRASSPDSVRLRGGHPEEPLLARRPLHEARWWEDGGSKGRVVSQQPRQVPALPG